MTTITALPTPPTRADPATFSARGDAFMTALPTFATETNTVVGELNTANTNANTQAANALASATAAAASAVEADATIWVTSTSYTAGQCKYDPVDFMTYRCIADINDANRPGLNPTYWRLAGISIPMLHALALTF